MRAILSADNDGSPLWIASGELVEIPEFTLTEPTDKGPEREDAVEDRATDEVERPVLLRLAPALPPAVAPDSLPPIREEEPPPAPVGTTGASRPEPRTAGASRPEARSDEQSTGLYESWDEADPYTTGEFPSLPAVLADEPPGRDPYLSRASRDPVWEREMTGPRLALVQEAPVEEDYEGMRAAPMPIPPRPHRPEYAGPVRLFRPAPAEFPSDWLDDRHDTLIVIDPTLRGPGRSQLAVACMDALAWAIGFAATFLVGAATTGSAGVVLIALTR